MASNYPDDIQFAGLVEAATAAADAHQRDLGKRKRGEENAYISVSTDAGFTESPKTPTLSNSAAVLFREPSEKSKKYSRPPLGKVFTSLELAPEEFLKLQNAAKAYMLSDDFPERKDVVGHKKHNNNNDQAKLKLYQCVEGFLQQDNSGETFFGHSTTTNNPDLPPRTFYWPEDRSRIVKLLMPLLRKMVTNERQRIYAAETRKQDPGKVEIKGRKTNTTQRSDTLDVGLAPEIDPSLQSELKENNSLLSLDPNTDPDDVHLNPGSLTLRVNIITRVNGMSKRIAPEFVIPVEGAGTLDQFVDGLKKNFETLNQSFEVKAFLPSGLVIINTEEEWVMAQMTVATEEWMNGQLQLLVEM